MTRVALHFDSMPTPELRKAIVALRHAIAGTETEKNEKHGRVGVEGPQCWNFTTPPLEEEQVHSFVYNFYGIKGL